MFTAFQEFIRLSGAVDWARTTEAAKLGSRPGHTKNVQNDTINCYLYTCGGPNSKQYVLFNLFKTQI